MKEADIVGEFIDTAGVTRGFVRFSNGSFSAPIVDPNDTVGFTEGRGINNPRTVGRRLRHQRWYRSLVFYCRATPSRNTMFHGTVQTNLLSINEPGDITGAFDPRRQAGSSRGSSTVAET